MAYNLQLIADKRRHSMIDKELLDILACPACKADVKLEGERIVCTKCGRRYPIRNDIPIMLIDEAEMPPGDAQPTA
jgi:uncharacterized protein YbaR (Trm112 family)